MEEHFLSAAEVASWAGVHYRTIENWKAQGKIESEGGKYGLKSAIKYRIGELERELEEIKNNPQAELKYQKLLAEVETQKAIARIRNLEADQLEGKLVEASEVIEIWKNAIAACKSKFLAIPSRLALELSGMDNPEAIQGRITEVVEEALKELVVEN